MSVDLSKYWSQLRQTEKGWVHPDDEKLLGKEPHSFNLDFPPPAFVGDVITARVIILVANGGYDPKVTPREFEAPDSEAMYLRRLSRPTEANWAEVAPYYRGVNYAELVFSGKAAAVNACAYRSRKISEEPDNRRLLKRLPSVRFNRAWLMETILPQVDAGKRFIVGKRHGLWGLPGTVISNSGFLLDPAPVSPHLSKVVWDRLQQVLACV